ncbi:MAG TPA: gliding motility protein GldL [Cytophagales bacterium]|nr:gliding motility protein GldL [Cytophagales bacterium]
MSAKKGGFSEFLFNTIMPKIYGIGAAIVIVGAMFKIMHWPGAGAMLVVGLSTEAIIFLFSAFQPMAHEPDWTRVYPELADDFQGGQRRVEAKSGGESPTKKLDQMFSEAKIEPVLIDSLGKGMRSLTETVGKMNSLSDATVATSEYTKNVKEASKSILDLNKSYSNSALAMEEMTNASKDAKDYHVQVQAITKNLGSLNAVYEMELQDANSHLKAMNKFYGSLTTAMESMSEASKDTQQFKNELSTLTSNLTNLNKVYGNMLSAMKN